MKRADLPKGEVLVQLCEEDAERNAWPDVPPQATETYREDCFGFFEVPHKYIDTGVRADRGFPFLLRAAAVVNLPAGKHRILLAPAATRLYFDEKLLLTTPFPPATAAGTGSSASRTVT